MRRLALLAIMTFLPMGLLFAAWSFDVCVQNDSANIARTVQECFKEKVLTLEEVSSIRVRVLQEDKDQAGIALAKAWESADMDAITKAREEYGNIKVDDPQGPVPVRLVDDPEKADLVMECSVRDVDIVKVHTILANGVEVYSKVSSSDAFDDDALLFLNTLFGYEGYVPVQEPEEQEISQRETFSGLKIQSNTQAKVFVDGKEVGTTPLTLGVTSLPAMIRLEADGYEQAVTTLTSPKLDVLNVELVPSWMAQDENFQSSRKTFYRDMAISMAVFGLRCAFRSICHSDPAVRPWAWYGSCICDGALAVSLTVTVSSLLDYFTYSESV